MKVLCIIKPSAGLFAGIGRSLCRRRPVSMPASAVLYAGVGRSLCRQRPVSMPAQFFLEIDHLLNMKKMCAEILCLKQSSIIQNHRYGAIMEQNLDWESVNKCILC